MRENVCAKCFGELGIQAFINGEASEFECDFCGETAVEPIAASLRVVVKYMEERIGEEYDDAANWLSYISSEGGWQGQWWDTWDLLTDQLALDLPRDDNDELIAALVRYMDDRAWCKQNPYGLSYEEAGRFSWERFCQVVKHERRFFFTDHGSGDREILSPGETLDRIFDHAETIGLFRQYPAGSRLFRARKQEEGETFTTIDELGPPPPDKANQSNRMSPPGVVMFYASDNDETALREIALQPGTFAVGRFKTRRDALLLDLVALPAIPSLFDETPDSLEYHPRRVLTFLHQIAWEISRPIARDDRVHVNYVPTQIVTEYVRSRQLADGRRIDGIRFESAVHPGHASYVLFATQDNMVGGSVEHYGAADLWIELESVVTTTRDAEPST